jgi:hypothetical protein
VNAQIAGMKTAISICAGENPTNELLDHWAARLKRLLLTATDSDVYAERLARTSQLGTSQLEAALSAGRDCALFDMAVASGQF